MKKLTTLAVILFLSMPLAHASETAKDCLETATSNVDFSKCYADKINEADKQLNLKWKEVAAYLRGLEKSNKSKVYQSMLAEQRSWVRFKENACQYYRAKTQDFGREGAVIGYGGCQLGILEDRLRYLQNFLSDHQPDK